MPITVDELTGAPPNGSPTQTESPPDTDSAPAQASIVEWVSEIPQRRRSTPFDAVIEEVRQANDPNKFAKIAYGDKTISANKVNQLRKKFPDCEFTQVTESGSKTTYVRVSPEKTE